MEHVRVFANPPPQARELELLPFLRWVGQTAVFRLKGADSSRCRALIGGLHGNEPSGFHALHALLRDPPRDLPCDALLVLGNVPAAVAEPAWGRRMLPGEEDMNRVWDAPGSPQRAAAAEVLDLLRAEPLEAVADLHNNTGYNPIYAVAISDDPNRAALARCWTHRVVRYRGQRLGTFLEQVDPGAPGVVVECGQAGDPEADRRAHEGARRFLSAPSPFEAAPDGLPPTEGFQSIARILIPPGVTLAFAQGPTEADLTIFPGIDRYNFCSMAIGTLLAYCSDRGRLEVIDNRGQDVTSDYLQLKDGRLFLIKKVVPVMMTTNCEVAKQDCLLYAAERVATPSNGASSAS